MTGVLSQTTLRVVAQQINGRREVAGAMIATADAWDVVHDVVILNLSVSAVADRIRRDRRVVRVDLREGLRRLSEFYKRLREDP